MKTNINIGNYEEIMFRLVEGDFDEQTRIDLLQQIEADELFKFEWESWQKTKFVDPLENYSDESRELADKIIMIAEPQVSARRKMFYYWAAAASVLVLIASLFFLMSDFASGPKQEVAEAVKKSPIPATNVITPVQNQVASIANTDRKQSQYKKSENQIMPVVTDSNTIDSTENSLAEIPLVIDSVKVKANELVKASEKKQRYTIKIETSDIVANHQNNNDLAQNPKVKIKKVFTNTKMWLSRKPNGEPDKIYIIGDENSYLCININY